MNKVCVLMSTYNGEKYLLEQIESILNQENVLVSLLVRDDGSKDNTIKILKSYEKEEKLKLILDKRNLGPANSFMEILYNSPDYEYYAFADQDDIWLKNKLLTAIEQLKDFSVPALYCSNQLVYKNEIVEGLRFKKEPNHGLVQAICGNIFSGCTMVFNKDLADVLKKNKPSPEVLRIRMHDTWVMAVAEYIGTVVYDHNSYIEYRIHANNTVGLKTNKINRFIHKISNKNGRHGRSLLAKELMKVVNENSEKKEVVESFVNKKGLLKNSILNNCGENKVLFVIKAAIGWV